MRYIKEKTHFWGGLTSPHAGHAACELCGRGWRERAEPSTLHLLSIQSWRSLCAGVVSSWAVNEKQCPGPGSAHPGCPCPSDMHVCSKMLTILASKGRMTQSVQQGKKSSHFVLFSLLISKDPTSDGLAFFSRSNLRISRTLSQCSWSVWK